MEAQEDSSENHHLMVVFFDILYQDGISLLDFPYEERRRRLEKVIEPVPDESMLSRRHEIKMRQSRD